MTRSVLQQLRRGLWLSVLVVFLPLLVLAGVGLVQERRDEAKERKLLEQLQEEVRADTCGPSPSDCDALAARVLELPPGRLPSPSAFGPYRFTVGNSAGKFLFLEYGREGTDDQLRLTVQRQAANPVGSATSPGGRRYDETVRNGVVTRLQWEHGGYRFTIVLLPPAPPGSETHVAAVALLDAVP